MNTDFLLLVKTFEELVTLLINAVLISKHYRVFQ